MNFDEGLKFEAQLLKIKKIISQVKELGIDTTKFELIVKKIEEEIKDPINEICNNYNARESIDNIFKSDFIASHYRETLKNLLNLEEKLIEEYNTYAEINGNLLLIESKLEKINEIELIDLLKIIEQTLRKLKTSSTINFEDEKILVEKAYQLTYQLIKLELLHLGSNTLLDSVLMDEIDTYYTEKYLLKEVSSLDASLESSKLILARVNQLKSKGLKSNYLDLELLNLLVSVSYPELIQTKKEFIITTYRSLEQKYNKIVKLFNEKVKKENTIALSKKEQQKVTKKILKYTSFLLGSLSMLVGTFVGVSKIVKKSSYDTAYYTIEQTYDVNKDKFTEEEGYQVIEPKDSTLLTVYCPYQENSEEYYPSSESYYREIYTYDVSELNYENIQDYVSIDLETFSFAPEITYEYKETLSAEDLYKTSRMIITKKIIDESNINLELNIDAWVAYTSLIYIIPFILEVLIIIASSVGIEDDPTKSFFDNFIKLIGDYQNHKDNISIQLEELLELKESLKGELTNFQDLLIKLEDNYNKMPSELNQLPELIEDVKHKVKELTKNENKYPI